MLERIRFELFIIKEVAKVAWWRTINARSLRPAVRMIFSPHCRYKIGDESWKKGNYYTYMKDFYSVK